MTASSPDDHDAVPHADESSSPAPEPGGEALRCIAVDLGASSGRVVLGTWRGGEARVELAHRFPHHPEERGGHLTWNVARLEAEIDQGVRNAAELADGLVDSVAVDGWAVDYARLDGAGRAFADPYCYRDPRTEGAMEEVWERISSDRLYDLTGIQFLRINTLYQLWADRRDQEAAGAGWMNLPEYFLCHLAGRAAPIAEYTNATHTQLLDARRRQWSEEIFAATGLDVAQAPELIQPGQRVGKLRPELSGHARLARTRVIAPACHDTGSAVAGIPARGSDWAFLSSGTWSLLGAVLDQPNTTAAARRHNFSNEGGLDGSIRFLKNVNGMWLLEECLRAWAEAGLRCRDGSLWAAESILEALAYRQRPPAWFDVERPELLLPGSMPSRLRDAIRGAGFTPPAVDDAPGLAHIIFNSLSRRYAEVLGALAEVTGRQFRRLFVVGGGSRNHLLNAMIAEDTGLEVVRGAVESAVAGNLAVQAAALSGSVTRDAVAEWAARWSAAEFE